MTPLQIDSINQLPPELLARIFKQFEYRERIRLEQICRHWHWVLHQFGWEDLRELAFTYGQLELDQPWRILSAFWNEFGSRGHMNEHEIIKDYGHEVEPEQLYNKLIWRTNIEEMKKTRAKVIPIIEKSRILSEHDKKLIIEDLNKSNYPSYCPFPRHSHLMQSTLYNPKPKQLGPRLAAILRRAGPSPIGGLRSLTLYAFPDDCQFGRYFKFMPNLRHLCLTSTILCEFNLTQIADNLPRLQTFNALINKKKIAFTALQQLLDSCIQLKALGLSFYPKYRKNTFQLRIPSNVQFLFIGEIDEVIHLDLSQCSQLKFLGGNWNFVEYVIRHWPQYFKSLILLKCYVSQLCGYSDESIKIRYNEMGRHLCDILKSCVNLGALSININHDDGRYHRFQNDMLLNAILNHLPNLEHLSICLNVNLDQEQMISLGRIGRFKKLRSLRIDSWSIMNMTKNDWQFQSGPGSFTVYDPIRCNPQFGQIVKKNLIKLTKILPQLEHIELGNNLIFPFDLVYEMIFEMKQVKTLAFCCYADEEIRDFLDVDERVETFNSLCKKFIQKLEMLWRENPKHFGEEKRIVYLYHFLMHKSYSVNWTSYCVEYDGKTNKFSWNCESEISERFCWHPKCENRVLSEICASQLDVTEIPLFMRFEEPVEGYIDDDKYMQRNKLWS